MTAKTLLAALVLAATPGIALASCNWGKEETVASCMEGSVWDAASQRCVTQATS